MTEPENKRSLLVHKPIVQKLIDLYAINNFEKFPDDIIDIYDNNDHVKKIKSDTNFFREYIYLMLRYRKISSYTPHHCIVSIPDHCSDSAISTIGKELTLIGFKVELSSSHYACNKYFSFYHFK